MTASNDTRLFLDESGECSCSESSDYKHFCIAILSVEASHVGAVKNRFKRQTARLIRNGWNNTKEIKAADLHRDKHFGPAAVKEFIKYLAAINTLRVSYLVVNKHAISSEALRNAEYGIRYNYFAGVLLSEMVLRDGFHSLHLTHDLRNKETHSKKRFREYIMTRIVGEAFENDFVLDFTVQGMDSHMCYGLSAVDFFSWAIFRKFEHGDSSYVELFADRLLRRREWYTKE